MELLHECAPVAAAVVAVLFALWWHGCHQREEGRLQGRAERDQEMAQARGWRL